MTGTAIVIGAAIAAGATAIGSAVNAISQSSTNSAQHDMMLEQMKYQTSEREAQQVYNNPVNQRKRLEAAGINPYFALSNIDAGNTTAQSAPGAPQLQAPQYGDIIKNLGADANQGINAYHGFQEAQSYQLGIERDKIDTRYKLVEKLLQLNEQRNKILGMNLDNQEKQKQLGLLDKQATRLQQDIDAVNADWNESRKRVIAERKIAEADADMKDLQKQYQSWFNNFQKQYGNAQLAEIKSIIANNMSAAMLNDKLSDKAVADKCLSEAQSKGIKIDNFQKNKINWMIREQVRLGNQYQQYTNDNFWKTKFLDVFGTGAVSAAGAYIGARGAKGVSPKSSFSSSDSRRSRIVGQP